MFGSERDPVTRPVDVALAIEEAIVVLDRLPYPTIGSYRAIRCLLGQAFIAAVNHPRMDDEDEGRP